VTLNDKQATSALNNNMISTLLKKIQDITGHRLDSVTNDVEYGTLLENHSPGDSPSQSMSTLVLKSLELAANNQPQKIEEPVNNQTRKIEEPVNNQTTNKDSIVEEPHASIDIPLPVLTPEIEPRKCPVCGHGFTATSDDVEVYDHIEKCLFPTGISTELKDLECPNCERKFPGNDEVAYHQHLSDCYNNDV
jgi:hypothetical protein